MPKDHVHGGLTDLKAEQLNIIQSLLTVRSEGKRKLFPVGDSLISERVESLWRELIEKKKVDAPLVAAEKRKKLLYEDTLCHKNVKEIGAEWMCLNTLDLLKLREFFKSPGWDDEQIRLTYTQLISRAVYPASEQKTTRWIRENSAVCELTGYPVEELTRMNSCLFADAPNLPKSWLLSMTSSISSITPLPNENP